MTDHESGQSRLILRALLIGDLSQDQTRKLEEECRKAILKIAASHRLAARVDRENAQAADDAKAGAAIRDQVEITVRTRMLSQVLNVPPEDVAQALASGSADDWQELLRKSDEERPKGHSDVAVVT